MKEAFVLKACRQWLTLHGIAHWRINQQGVPLHDGTGRYRKGPHQGMADLVGILPSGRFLSVECKAPGGRVRPEQWEFLRAVREAGGVALIVAGVDELAQGLADHVTVKVME